MSLPIEYEELRNTFQDLPNSRAIRKAFEYAREGSPPYLFHHAVRSWLFAISIAERAALAHDQEIVAIASLLHDLGLSFEIGGPYRFEVNGANAARAFAQEMGIGEKRRQLIWDAVALQAIPSIAHHKEIDVALVARGVGADFGQGLTRLRVSDVDLIVQAVPRLNMKEKFKKRICLMACQHSLANEGNFVRAFGERFVPGYQVPSVVDQMMNAPFDE